MPRTPMISPHLPCKIPDAGFYLWAKTPGSDTDFARDLYHQQNVVVLPGSYLAREVGGLWGLELMRRRPRSRRPASAASARHTVLGVLTDLGFGPEVGPGDEVRLRTCPILDSATTNPDVICSVHHGLVEGIRGALGRDEGTVGLEPFALPGACRLTLPR